MTFTWAGGGCGRGVPNTQVRLKVTKHTSLNAFFDTENSPGYLDARVTVQAVLVSDIPKPPLHTSLDFLLS